MAQTLRYGCALIAFSPPFFILLMLLSKRPQLVVVTLSSSFSWLVSALLTGLFWAFVKAISDSSYWPLVLIVSVLCQEGCRFSFVYAYRLTERIIKESSPNALQIFPMNDVTSSLAAGIGFGTMHSLMLYGALLAASNGNGDIFVESCPSVPLILVVSLIALLFTILDVVLTFFAFMAEKMKSTVIMILIVSIHTIASLSTLANQSTHGCSTSLPSIFVIVLLSICLLVWMWPLMMIGVTKPAYRNYS